MPHKNGWTSYVLGVNQRILKPRDKVYFKIKNIRAQYASSVQSPWSLPHDVIACKWVGVILRNRSNNPVIQVHADRLSNPTITLRHEAAAPVHDVPLVESVIASSVCENDSED